MNDNAVEFDLLTTREVADILRVRIATLRQWRHRSQGPRWVKLVDEVRYPRSALADYLAGAAVYHGDPRKKEGQP